MTVNTYQSGSFKGLTLVLKVAAFKTRPVLQDLGRVVVGSAHSLTRIEMASFYASPHNGYSAQEVLLDFLRPATVLQYLDASGQPHSLDC